MMTDRSTCPTLESLKELVAGTAPARQQADLVAHLDGCSACQRKLDELAGANSGLLRAASDQRLTVFAREGPLRQALGELANDPRMTSAYQTPGGSNNARALLRPARSEEHTSELQSRLHLVCRLLLEN